MVKTLDTKVVKRVFSKNVSLFLVFILAELTTDLLSSVPVDGPSGPVSLPPRVEVPTLDSW